MVEASAAEAEAISATLAAVKARRSNGDVEHLPDGDQGSEAMPSGKEMPSLIKVPELSFANNATPPGVRLHHRAVCNTSSFFQIFLDSIFFLLMVYCGKAPIFFSVEFLPFCNI